MRNWKVRIVNWQRIMGGVSARAGNRVLYWEAPRAELLARIMGTASTAFQVLCSGSWRKK